MRVDRRSRASLRIALRISNNVGRSKACTGITCKTINDFATSAAGPSPLTSTATRPDRNRFILSETDSASTNASRNSRTLRLRFWAPSRIGKAGASPKMLCGDSNYGGFSAREPDFPMKVLPLQKPIHVWLDQHEHLESDEVVVLSDLAQNLLAA